MMNGILCIHKPEGFTSFDVVAKLRGITHQKKIGHAGTLDPMATGVLPVFLGTATRACDLLPDSDKTYIAGFQLGVVTDTQDRTGTVLETRESSLTWEDLLSVMERFTGDQMQVPPMYSAVKIGGKKLYEIARQGGEIERPARPVTIYRLELKEFDRAAQRGSFLASCSKGTYIRTLCHDIGQALGPGAVLTSLCRTRAAGFDLSDCLTLQQVQDLADNGELEQEVTPVSRVFQSLPVLRLNQPQARMFVNGVKLDLNRLSLNGAGRHSVYGPNGEFLGLASPRPEQGELAIDKLFYQREG